MYWQAKVQPGPVGLLQIIVENYVEHGLEWYVFISVAS
jgi:hypothetical protein